VRQPRLADPGRSLIVQFVVVAVRLFIEQFAVIKQFVVFE
jgi:hypothetical protein